MLKSTRRSKNNKKNKTIKKGGSSITKINHNIEEPKVAGAGEKKERQGIVDMAGNTILNTASSVVGTAADLALGLAGYERKKDQEPTTSEPTQKPYDTSPGFISQAINVVDKAGAIAIGTVNSVLDSDAAKQTTSEAAKGTAQIVGNTAQTFNDAFNDPVIKAQIEKAVENAGELGGVIIKASDEPIQEAVGVAGKAATKAINAGVVGTIEVGKNALKATPGVGALVSGLDALNAASKGVAATVEAGSDVAIAAADAIGQTTKNVNKILKELEEKKKMGGQISNRTANSINEFENPTITSGGGGLKTRRRLLKRYTKSKRVRFFI